MPATATTAILDIDGTLVDTNYHHAIAWWRALRRSEVTVPLWTVHRHVGMGGDQLVAAVAGDDVEREHGDAVRDAHEEEYGAIIGEVPVLPGARELIDDLRARDVRVVLASSAKQQELDHYLDLLDVRERVDGWTVGDDVETTKPAPDLIRAALDVVGAEAADAVLVGDTTWDCRAAGGADVRAVCVRTGGFGADELRADGAAAVFDDLPALRAALDEVLGG